MTRTVPAAVSTAVALETTQPVYLIRMGWTAQSPDVERRICTWDTNISWNSETWTASGAAIKRLDSMGGLLWLPNGDTDPWLDLVVTQGAQGKTLQIYEHHDTDAVMVFDGLMDAVQISRAGIEIDFIAALLNKSFPHTSITETEYPWLLGTGDRIYWGPDVVLVE